MKVREEAIFNSDPQFYLKSYFDEEGRIKREVEGVGTISYKIEQRSQEGGVWKHVARSVEPLDAPGPVRKIFGQTQTMFEEASWREGSDTIEVTYRPEKMADKVSIRSKIIAVPHGEGQCKVTIECDIQVKIFGIGGMIEKMAAKGIPTHLKRDCDYFNAHIAPGAK